MTYSTSTQAKSAPLELKPLNPSQTLLNLLEECFDRTRMTREHAIQIQSQLVGIRTAQAGESPVAEHISPDALIPYIIEKLSFIKHIQLETIDHNEETIRSIEVEA